MLLLLLTRKVGTSFFGSTRLKLNKAGFCRETFSVLRSTATSEAKVQAELSSSRPAYLPRTTNTW